MQTFIKVFTQNFEQQNEEQHLLGGRLKEEDDYKAED